MNVSVEEFKDKSNIGSYVKLLSTENSKTENKQTETSNFTCNCERNEGINYCCSRALNWFNILNKHKQLNLEKMRQLYHELIECQELSDYEDQIMKDLARTFPKCPQFQEQQGQTHLKRVLLAFSRYDSNLGYVQGMNFIVGSILYHANEEIAFWIFVSLIEEFELRDIYEPLLPGLYKHCFVIEKLIESNLPELYKHFNDHNIMAEMYATDWILCLFSNIIPLPLIGDFYDLFITQGWVFFYRFSLSMLGAFREKLLEEDDFSGILSHIKFKTPDKHNPRQDMEEVVINGSNQKGSPSYKFVVNDKGNIEKQVIQVQQQSTLQRFLNLLIKK